MRALLLATWLIGCGSAPATETNEPTPEVVAAEAAAAAAPAEPEPVAPGAQLAGGRLGATLEGLAPGDWHVRGPWGTETTDHVLTRTTERGPYALHVVSWESFGPIPIGPLLAAATDQAATGEPVTLRQDDDLAVVAVFTGDALQSGSDTDLLIDGAGNRVLAQIVVAVYGATFVHMTLACERSEACDADEPTSVARELAASLRRGPALRGGAEWTLRLPDGEADREITITLPNGVAGVPLSSDGQGNLVAAALELETGRAVLTVQLGAESDGSEHALLEPGSGAGLPSSLPSRAAFGCSPFRCVVGLPERSSAREEVVRAFLGARERRLPVAAQDLPIAGGRLLLAWPGPALDPPFGELGDEAASSPRYVVLRYGGGPMRLVVTDTMRAPADALAHARQIGGPEDVVEAIEAPEGLDVVRITHPASADGRYPESVRLLVTRADSTAVTIGFECRRESACVEQRAEAIAALVSALRPGTPHPTTRDWSTALAGRRIRMRLPEGYVVESWDDPHHGGSGVTAHHVRAPAASLMFESSGYAPDASIENSGERTGRRTTLRLGTERFVMRERRRSYDGTLTWGADLGCAQEACVIMIRTADLTERDRLLDVLANATVERCAFGYVTDEEPLNVRTRPSTSGDVVGEVGPETRLTLGESRGRWTQITEPHTGWVWTPSIAIRCR